MLRTALLLTVSVLAVLVGSMPAAAQWVEVDKLTASDAAEGDKFGLTAQAVSATLYATGVDAGGNYSALFTVNVVTGLATEVGPTGQGYFLSSGGLAYDSKNNRLLGLGQNVIDHSGPTTSELFVVDQSTGAATSIGWTGSDALLSGGGLTYDAANDIFYATGKDNTVGPLSVSTLYTVDPSTGLATRIGPTGENNLAAGGLAFDSTTEALFGTGNTPSPDNSSLFLVDTTTGGAAQVGPTQGPYYLDSGGLAMDPSSGLLYATGVQLNASSGTWEAYLFTVDRGSGAATMIGPTGAFLGFGGLAFVPEPSTLILLTMGAVGLRVYYWRRNRQIA